MEIESIGVKMIKVLTKVDVTERVYKETGMPRTIISDILSDLFEEVCINLKQDKNVKITSFGTFKTRYKNERLGRNPKTGEEAIIEARRVVSFSANKKLKEKTARKIND